MTSPRAATDPIRERLAAINAVDSGRPDFMLVMGTNYRHMREALNCGDDVATEPKDVRLHLTPTYLDVEAKMGAPHVCPDEPKWNHTVHLDGRKIGEAVARHRDQGGLGV